MTVKEFIKWLKKFPENGTVSFMTIDSVSGHQFFESIGGIVESNTQEILLIPEVPIPAQERIRKLRMWLVGMPNTN